MSREIDSCELFKRFAKPEETHDEDWMKGMQEAIRNEGDQVGKQEWDSGSPGAGAGVSYVYLFRRFFSQKMTWACMARSTISLKRRRSLAS
jgi:hypothetical protein